MPSVVLFYFYAEWHYANRHYGDSHGAVHAASGDSTVVEHLPQHPRVKGSCPAATADPGRKNWRQ
jgi:hypothetical protein